jgi:hypothetical protein
MSDKNSPHYVRSEFKRCYSRDKKSLTYEESLKVEGSDEDEVDSTLSFVGDLLS